MKPHKEETPPQVESTVDKRMAKFLADDSQSLKNLRKELTEETSAAADDLLGE